ncbi:MAG: phosphate acetyltransferase [Anaerolineae bacterium]|nr:phosphate acetyltransferase [Anaerolineae bacterium]
MTNTIYITTTEPYCGKSLIALGIMDLMLRKTKKVGFFRPIVRVKAPEEHDKNIDLVLKHFNLNLTYEETYAFSQNEVNSLIGQGHYDDVLDKIVEKYKALESKCDFVLCVGSDFVGVSSAFEFDINIDIVRNLGCPVLIVGNAAQRDIEAALSPVQVAIDLFMEKDCPILGTIINRADPDQVDDLLAELKEKLTGSDQILSVIPANKRLGSPTLKEIADYLGAEVLYLKSQLANQAYRYLIIAMQVQNFLAYVEQNSLLITPGDRVDVILAALQAHQSSNYPQIAGILLTGGLKLPRTVERLLDGLTNMVPILAVDLDTYETVNKINHVHSYISTENHAKIALSLKTFDDYVDTKTLERRISAVEVRGLTPRMFLYSLIQKAKSNKQHIVFPEGTEGRILKAAEILLDQDVVDITLLGNVDEVRAAIKTSGRRINLDQIKIVEPQHAPKFFSYVQTLFELRAHRGLTLDAARDLMIDVSYFGTMMVYKGDADGMVSGSVNTTQHTIRPALQFVKTKPGVSVVSSVFFMALEDRVIVYGDCAVNPNPTAEELSEIAISSAETAQAFGVDPKVAMLSYSSGDSGKGAEVEKVREATRLAREKRPDLLIEGPIQYDAAVDPTVAAQKMPDSKVAGQATVLIFPDLNTGNNTYKAVQRETGAMAIGPILQGLNKPVNDLSRGCTVEDIVNTVVITAIQAQNAKNVAEL